MSFLRAVATVSGLTLASRVFGLARDIVSAAVMGAGPIADAFFVALRLPNFFRRMTAEGAFSVSFVPLFTKTLEQEGKEAATVFANQSIALLLVLLIPFSVLAILFMPSVIHVLAPGFDSHGAARFDLAVTLTRITFLYLLCMSLAALVGGMLNSLDKFAIFAVAPVAFNIMQIGFLGLFYFNPNSFPTAGHALAWGVLVSGVIQVIWMGYSLHRHGWRLKLIRPVFSDKIKRLLKLMGPGMIGASAVQINMLVDTIIASTLPIGAVSYLYYADRLSQLPLGLIGTAMGTALLPKLAQKLAAKEIKGASHIFNRALEWSLLLTLPCALILLVLAQPLLAVLFQRGAFDVDTTRATALALQAYSLGLPAFVAVKVLSIALYAQEDTKTPVKITLWCALVNIILCLLFIFYMHEKTAHAGIALSTSIAGWLQLGILVRKIIVQKHLTFDPLLQRNLQLILLACAALTLVLMVCSIVFMPHFIGAPFYRLAAIIVTLIFGMGAFLALIFGTGVLKIKELKQSFLGEK